jgi:hypothetical protein
MTEKDIRGTMTTRPARPLLWAMAAVMAVLGASQARAIERRALPDLRVTDLQGQAVAAAALPQADKWLLLYVEPKCPACDALLKAIDVKAQPSLPAHTAIVVGRADATAAAALAARFPDLAGARWYVEGETRVMKILKLPGAPVVFGLKQETIEWSIAGLVPDVGGVKSALVSWAGER